MFIPGYGVVNRSLPEHALIWLSLGSITSAIFDEMRIVPEDLVKIGTIRGIWCPAAWLELQRWEAHHRGYSTTLPCFGRARSRALRSSAKTGRKRALLILIALCCCSATWLELQRWEAHHRVTLTTLPCFGRARGGALGSSAKMDRKRALLILIALCWCSATWLELQRWEAHHRVTLTTLPWFGRALGSSAEMGGEKGLFVDSPLLRE